MNRLPPKDKSPRHTGLVETTPFDSEHWLRALITSTDDGIITKTLDGIVTSWNPGAEQIFGYTSSEMIGRPISVLVPRDRIDEEIGILATIRRGERVKPYETPRVRKDGTIIYVSLTVSPIIDETGQVLGAAKIVRDVSARIASEMRERKMLEEAQNARREAEAASRVKDEFLAIISHELRTPLTAVVGWVQLLRSGSLDPASTERALEVIDRNVRVQTQLIEDLLDVSRITMGKLRLDIHPIDPATVVNAAAESLYVAADARQVQLHLNLSPTGTINADTQRLQQVVWNILSNAIKFSPRNGSIDINLDQVGNHVNIAVRDYGKGIDEKFLPYIFDRFSQSEASNTRRHGGLGIGLAISKALTELHGGRIRADSEGEGKGATFTVTLPISGTEPVPVYSEVQARNNRPATHCPHEIEGLKTLVVDDDQDTCDVVRTTLEQCGAVVQTATSAPAGLELLNAFEPDVMIFDVSMPGMDGYELIRRVREAERGKSRKIPAVALTAFARVEDRAKALTLGYQMHVAKPVEPGELLKIVAALAGFFKNEPGQDTK